MKDSYIPSQKWEFNEEVSSVFTDMVSRSIPNYDVMRDLCYAVGRNYMEDGALVADIGCSNGLSCERLITEFPTCKFLLFDVSKPMLEQCKKRYEQQVKSGQVDVLYADLRDGVPFEYASLAVSCLTIQFTPIEYRQKILDGVYAGLRPGGAFLMVEKVLGNSSHIDDLMVKEYYSIKRENGYSEELIRAKRRSLEGALVPLTSEFNEKLLRNAGFRQVDTFWKFLNFEAKLAIK